MRKAIFRLLTELSSQKWISACTGRLAKSAMSRRWIASFAKSYGISIEDAEKELSEYASLNDFFSRRLKPGLRPIDTHARSVISPVDAKLTGIGRVEGGRIINVKGQDYTLEELLNRSPRSVNFMNGFYMVLYLSPTDYHRIHSPIAGRILESEHLPGKVYPVNDFGMRHMRKTLSRNERLITYIGEYHAQVAVVKVGAMNVSSIQYVESLGERVDKGDELAYFEFGSTVVLLLESGAFNVRPDLMLNSKIKMGEAVGEWIVDR